MAANKRIGDIPLNEKLNLTIEEAAVYTGVGQRLLRKWMKDPSCPFCIWIGPKKMLVRRKELEEFLASKKFFYDVNETKNADDEEE